MTNTMNTDGKVLEIMESWGWLRLIQLISSGLGASEI